MFNRSKEQEKKEAKKEKICSFRFRIVLVSFSRLYGDDNYFHTEWQRAVRGESDKEAVFVPWYEIEIYRKELADSERREVAESLDSYEKWLLGLDGVSLEAAAWYHDKRREYSTHEQMMAEYPSTPEEAFCGGGGERLDPSDFF